MLEIYLNDHLGGATGGVELVRRAAAAQRGTRNGPELRQLAEEIAADRETLLAIMRRLDVPVRLYKVGAGWAAEKVGRLKLNGAWVGRSPLSSVVELEGLLVGVNGKAALWRTLRGLADADPRLDAAELDGLMRRADDQLKRIEDLRLVTSLDVFGSAP
ncbi:MAG: hypothetical protein ACRDWY_14925 [Actinomycetes bacterium]